MRATIGGMHCDACVRRVKMTLEKSGAQVHQVQIGWADVSVDPAREAAMLEALRQAGFEPQKT